MHLWKDLKASLPEGLAEATVERIRRATAPAREEERCSAAVRAAAEWLEEAGLQVPGQIRVLCWAEARGLYGGGDQDPGAGTQRHVAFRACGAGRRQAHDGPAWTQAIADGSWEMSPRGYNAAPAATPEGVVTGGTLVEWGDVMSMFSPEEQTNLLLGLMRHQPELVLPLAAWLDQAVRASEAAEDAVSSA